MFPQQNTVADYHVPEDMFGPGPYAPQQQAAAGVSLAAFAGSPALAALSALSGLGQDPTKDESSPIAPIVALAVITGMLAIGGVLSYQAGKAMTPAGSSKKTWGWLGVPVGLFTGVLGLGIMGAVSNAKEK